MSHYYTFTKETGSTYANLGQPICGRYRTGLGYLWQVQNWVRLAVAATELDMDSWACLARWLSTSYDWV